MFLPVDDDETVDVAVLGGRAVAAVVGDLFLVEEGVGGTTGGGVAGEGEAGGVLVGRVRVVGGVSSVRGVEGGFGVVLVVGAVSVGESGGALNVVSTWIGCVVY
ncbi:hypothetical protein L6164_023014 [Bauhinia variegata]|uniref:Uncharacterized protein n=1 Tax=Bauhinia variegata TaxID=167791 RepID=A0ACB9MIU4_BAUVA|nr:hypothetical protein L6164_023014 [Bauhinia variegata]